MDLQFFEQNGELRFSFSKSIPSPIKKHPSAYIHHSLSGSVPKEIVERGEKEIRRYVMDRVGKYIKEKKEKAERRSEQYKLINFEVSAKLDKKTLTGRICYSADKDCLMVMLEKPIHNDSEFHYGQGFASAMAGHRMFKDGEKLIFTDEAIERAKADLIQLYKDWQNRKTIELAKKLNGQ